MESVILRSPSVGSVVKKIIAINPELNTSDIIDLLRQSIQVQVQPELAGEFAQAEIVDEAKAIRLAQETLRK